jgi:hypothetical protein
LIGQRALKHLLKLYDDAPGLNEIKLRRVEAHGQCIQFHLDHLATRVMQVPLNGESEYVGGKLLYATHNRMLQPARPAGSATIHDNTLVHGVSEMVSGVRYGLYFLSRV